MSTERVQFRFVGDEPREVSILPEGTLRRLVPDELFDVPAAHWPSYACQPAFYQALDEDPDRRAMPAVLDLVGDDPAAAVEALRVERMSPNARPKLLAELEDRAAGPVTAAVAPTPAEDISGEQPSPVDPASTSTSTED